MDSEIRPIERRLTTNPDSRCSLTYRATLSAAAILVLSVHTRSLSAGPLSATPVGVEILGEKHWSVLVLGPDSRVGHEYAHLKGVHQHLCEQTYVDPNCRVVIVGKGEAKWSQIREVLAVCYKANVKQIGFSIREEPSSDRWFGFSERGDLLNVPPQLLDGGQTAVFQSEPKAIFARFVGRIQDMGLPTEPMQVIPVGYDPRFAVDVQVISVKEGSLPWVDSQSSGPQCISFLIHSPTLFFGVNLKKTPEEFPDLQDTQFLFTLVGERHDSSGWSFDLTFEEYAESDDRTPLVPIDDSLQTKRDSVPRWTLVFSVLFVIALAFGVRRWRSIE